MGLPLESFRAAAAAYEGQLLTVDYNKVNGQEMQEIKGKDIDISDLKNMPSNDGLNRAKDGNIYLRNQLLNGIRDCLVANKLMSVSRQGNTETVSYAAGYADKVQAFLKTAEETLIGVQPGDNTASDDLLSMTVTELLEKLDELEVESTDVTIESADGTTYDWTLSNVLEKDLTTAQRELRMNCPGATDKQQEALVNLDSKSLASCLGMTEKVAKALQPTSIKPSDVSKAGFLECTVADPKTPNVIHTVLVDRQGTVFSKEDYTACQKFMVTHENGHVYLEKMDHRDMKLVRGCLEKMNAHLERLESMEGDESVNHVSSTIEDALTTFTNMLVNALPRARRLQPKGELTMKTLWTALRFDKNPNLHAPKNLDDPTAGQKLVDASMWRCRKDFLSSDPRTADVQTESLGDQSNKSDLKNKYYPGFILGWCDKVDHYGRLFARKCRGSAPLSRFFHDYKVPEHAMRSSPGSSAKSTLTSDLRAKGSVWRFGELSYTTGDKGESQEGVKHVDAFVSGLQNAGFKDEQIWRLTDIPNNGPFSVLSSLGYAQSQLNMRIGIEKDGEDMKVTYYLNCFPASVDQQTMSTTQSTEECLRYEVRIDKEGKVEFLDMSLVDEKETERFDTAETFTSETVKSVGEKAIDPTPEQMQTVIDPDSRQLASALGISDQEADTVTLDEVRLAADGKSLVCKARRADKPDAEVVVYGNGTIVSKATYDKSSADLLNTLNKIDSTGISKEILSAFRGEDYDQVRTYLDLFANIKESEYGDAYLSRPFTGAVLVNLLAEKMGQIRQLQEKGVNMMDALWQALQLPGKAPQLPKNKMSAQDSAAVSLQLVTALRTRIYNDFAAAWGYDKTEKSDGFKALCIGSEDQLDAAFQQIPGNDRTLMVQRLGYLVTETGLSYSAKLRMTKGQMDPPVSEKDFLFLANPHVSPLKDNPLNKAKADITLTRYIGAKWTYHGQQGEMTYENKAGNDSQANDMVNQWNADGFTGEQIYQLGAYVNNGGQDLLKGFASIPSGNGLNVSVSTGMVHKDGEKDMVVRASLPIARPIGHNGTTFQARRTNYVVVHEFVLHPDGTSQTISEQLVFDQEAAKLRDDEREFDAAIG